MIPPALRHPSVLVTALACLAATAMLTALTLRRPHGSSQRHSGQWADNPQPLPPFNLLKPDGSAFTNADMAGQVWVCDFFLTHCRGVCPKLTRVLYDLRAELAADPAFAKVRLLSINVDPEVDTPAVLRDYRAKLELKDDDRWLHVTSASRAETWNLCAALHFHVAENPGNDLEPIIHTDRLLLVDAQGRVRGTYKGLDDPVNQVPSDLADLKHDLSLLLQEPAEEPSPERKP